MIRPAELKDSEKLVRLADATGVFKAGEAASLLGGVLKDYYGGGLGEGHQVYVCTGGNAEPVGWVYFSPSYKADGVWDLWWIGVDPSFHSQGFGLKLVEFVESTIRGAGGRILIIETSSTSPFNNVRDFYRNRGYSNCGTIPDYYGPGDDKVTFVKRLTA